MIGVSSLHSLRTSAAGCNTSAHSSHESSAFAGGRSHEIGMSHWAIVDNASVTLCTEAGRLVHVRG